jgi:hypothetical protein
VEKRGLCQSGHDDLFPVTEMPRVPLQCFNS